MLAAAPVWLQALDGLLLALGVAVLVGWAASVTRRRAWRAPIAGVPLSAASPIHAVLAFAAYFLVQALAVGAVTARFPQPKLAEIGSEAWRTLMLAADVSKSAVIVVIAAAVYGAGRRRRAPIGSAARALGIALAGALAALVLSSAQAEAARVLYVWSGHPLPEHPVILALQAGGLGPGAIVQLVIGAVLIASVCEEVLFRGVVHDALHNATGRFWPAAIISATLFGAVHIPQVHAVLPLATLGVVLSMVRAQTGRLWPAIVLHAVFNARTIALVLSGASNT